MEFKHSMENMLKVKSKAKVSSHVNFWLSQFIYNFSLKIIANIYLLGPTGVNGPTGNPGIFSIWMKASLQKNCVKFYTCKVRNRPTRKV